MGVSPAFSSLCPFWIVCLVALFLTWEDVQGGKRSWPAWEQIKCLFGEGGGNSFLFFSKQLKVIKEIMEIAIPSWYLQDCSSKFIVIQLLMRERRIEILCMHIIFKIMLIEQLLVFLT